MMFLEGFLLWTAIAIYTVSFFSYLWCFIFKKEQYTDLIWKILLSAWIFQTICMVLRAVEAGHPPVYYTFEHALTSTWFVGMIYLVASRKSKKMQIMGVIVSAFIIMVIGYGMMSYGTQHEPLPPPYQNNWLWVHVTFAWFAYSAFLCSSVVAVLYLLRLKAYNLFSERFWDRLPSSEEMEELSFRIIIFGFIGLTIEMGAGAIWAYSLWGRYWAWDPMETWTLISWVTYAMYLHLRVTMGWRGAKIVWVALLAFIFIFISFGGLAMMKGLHQPLV